MRRFGIRLAILGVGCVLGSASAGAQASGPDQSSSSSAVSSGGSSSSAPSPAASQNAFTESVPSKLVPGVLPLSLQEAIDRGLKQNLGLLLSNTVIRSARGQRWDQLSALFP